MSIFEQIVNHFNAHIEATSSSIEELTPYLAEATHLGTQTLLDNHKIFCASSAFNQSIAEQFCQNLRLNPAIARPSLPAINLNKTLPAAFANDALAQQLQALANAGDLLLLLSISGDEAELIDVMQQAKQSGVNIILINAGSQLKLSELLPADMVKIQLPNLSHSQALSLQFLLIQLLSELIEQQLFPGLSE